MAKNNNNVIGGEFAISYDLIQQKKKNGKNDEDKFFYSSGRVALYAILKDIEQTFDKSGGVLLPDFLCDSITNTVIDAGWNYTFYHIGRDFHIDCTSFNDLDHNKTVILLIDYFGMTDLTKDILGLKEKYPNTVIVVDCVQAYYSMDKYDADYCFTSFRKWFPCPDGAMVLKKTQSKMIDIDMEPSVWQQYKFAGNFLKCFPEYVGDDIVLDLLEKGEEYLDKHYLCNWDEESKKIYAALDIELIGEKRRKNAQYLHEKLSDMNIEHIYKEGTTPLFIPILVDGRDELRRAFFKENIFTPKHWPVTSEAVNGVNELYAKELSLICDQRYTLDDMEAQIGVILKNRQGLIL